MKDVEPLDDTDRTMMWKVAAGWVRARSRSSCGSALLDAALREFTPIEEAALLQSAAKVPLPLDLGPTLGWIIGEPLGKTTHLAVPVATVQLDCKGDAISRCCIRAAVLQEREDGTVGTHGWRFELAEDGESALHPYQHAQAIIGWTIDGTCLMHPADRCGDDCRGLDQCGDEVVDDERTAAIQRVNQSHPAFAFGTRTMTGLMAATVGSLYGAPRLKAIIDADPRLSRASGAIASDLRLLAG